MEGGGGGMLQERELDGYEDYSGERCYGGRHPGNSGPSDGRMMTYFQTVFLRENRKGERIKKGLS